MIDISGTEEQGRIQVEGDWQAAVRTQNPNFKKISDFVDKMI